MMASPSSQALATARGRLGPYAARALDTAQAFALAMHADEFAVEHLFSSILADEESAAAQAILHAFADPQTLSVELMAMSPGITVVGAERCIPFSVRGVVALRAAQSAAPVVEPRNLFAAAFAELDDALAGRLRDIATSLPAADDGRGLQETAGPIFQRFSSAAKRAASRAGHEALRLERRAISPAHMVLGALEADEDLRAETGLALGRVRGRLQGADPDPTPPAPRDVPPTPELVRFLAGLGPDSDTLALLALLFERGRDELVQLFLRQRVTPDVLARAREGYADPDA